MKPRTLGVLIAMLLPAAVPVRGAAPASTGYRKPPAPIPEILNAPPTPQTDVSPDGRRALLIEWRRYPSIAELSQPVLRLAGLRINPNTNGPHLVTHCTGYLVEDVASGAQRRVHAPTDGILGAPVWSPDGTRLAFTQTTGRGIRLWTADAATGVAHMVEGVRLNAATGPAFQWMPDGRSLLCATVPTGRGRPPARAMTPSGPNIQESSGKPAPVRTYEDLLRSHDDEALFDYYATAQLALVSASTGHASPVGKPGIYAEPDPAPDGRHLLVERYHRPYSYLVGLGSFPRDVEVWSLSGLRERTIASLPSDEGVPIGGVPLGPRSCEWVPTDPATLVWREALDGGNPRNHVPFRDRVLRLKAPFHAPGEEWTRTAQRCVNLTWLESGNQALITDYDREKFRVRTALLSLRPGVPARVLWDRNSQDRYGDPGNPLLHSVGGKAVAWRNGDEIYLTGNGASPEGDRPFLDRYNLSTGKIVRLFRCETGSYESVIALAGRDGKRALTRRESTHEPPNLRLRDLQSGAIRALTHFSDPAPQLKGITKKLVTYRRADGVPLSFTLYLPAGYREGQRLPTFVWAYPREFGDAASAGQVNGSPYRFTTVAGPSHLFLLTQGYAVLDDATMPVVGPKKTANDTFVEQIVASARAAIEKATELGVTDPNRVAVGGHSYGAFMTANLLAHSDLFRAGVARSGAYNRTLTPFGFQAEDRTLWEAPEIYAHLSPFNYADQLHAPLLLIHGEADDNPGTFPIQSERMFQAIKGNGGTVRYVTLPYEAHGYRARESIEHTLWEMIDWLDRWVKKAPSERRGGAR